MTNLLVGWKEGHSVSVAQRGEVGPFWDTAECCTLEPEPWSSGPKSTAPSGGSDPRGGGGGPPSSGCCLLLLAGTITVSSGSGILCGMGRGGMLAFLPSALEEEVGKHPSLLSAAHRTRGWVTVGDGGQCGGGGLPPKSCRLSSRELTGRDHSRARAFQMDLLPPWSHVPLELPCQESPLSLGAGMRGFQAKPDLLGLSVVASCVCLSGVCVPPWQPRRDCTGKTLPCFSVTHTLKMHLTLEIGVFHTSSNCLLPTWWGWGGGPVIQLQQYGVSPDPTGKGLCPTRLPPLQRPTARSKLGTHPSSLD